MPVALAPVGLTGLNWADGEILAARAAGRFGVPYTLSTMSICSIEDVAGAVSQPFWFQLYVMRDRGFAASLIERAKAAKCSALVLTLDLQIQGQRHQDLKNGLAVPPQAHARHGFRHHEKARLGAERAAREEKVLRQPRGAHPRREEPDHAVAVDRRPVRPDAVVEGRRVGEEAVGRQAGPQGHPRRRGREDRRLPAASTRSWSPTTAGASSTARSPRSGRCRRLSEAVGDKTEVWLDGGIRSGQDVLRALALGAQGDADRPRLRLRAGRDGRGGRDARARAHPAASSTSPWRCAACAT